MLTLQIKVGMSISGERHVQCLMKAMSFKIPLDGYVALLNESAPFRHSDE